MTRQSKRYLLAAEILLIFGLVLYFRGHLMALLSPENKVLVDRSAPELALGSWINSEPLRLQSLRGNVVLLDFWTYACGPCRKAIPRIEEWHKKYPGLVIIGVHSPETEEESALTNLRKEVTALGITYPVATDNRFLTWNAYKTQLWPTIHLIDKKGLIRDIHRGSIGLGEVEEMIQTLLKE